MMLNDTYCFPNLWSPLPRYGEVDIGAAAICADYVASRKRPSRHDLQQAFHSFADACDVAARRALETNGGPGGEGAPPPLLQYIGFWAGYFAHDPGRPDFDHWFRRHMPYVVEPLADGSLVLGNRDYTAIHDPVWLVAEPAGINGVWQGLDGGFYLHPGTSPGPDYFARLATLASLETSVYPHVKVTRDCVPFHQQGANKGRCLCSAADNAHLAPDALTSDRGYDDEPR